jgi:hypothetical protein
MGSFGSRGGLRGIVPVRSDAPAAPCVATGGDEIPLSDTADQPEPFVDLRDAQTAPIKEPGGGDE